MTTLYELKGFWRPVICYLPYYWSSY